MKREHYIQQFPDLIRIPLMPGKSLSRTQTEEFVANYCQQKKGLVAYYNDGDHIMLLASKIMAELQEQLTLGAEMANDEGQIFVITSSEIFLCGGEPCVRARFSSEDVSDVYACKYFTPLN